MDGKLGSVYIFKKNITSKFNVFTQGIPPSQSKLLIVEGNDDLVIMEALCGSLNIKNIHFHCIEGKENLAPFLELLKNDRSITQGNLKSIGIILDADNKQPDSTFKSVSTYLQSSNFAPPSQLCIFT